MTRSRMGNVSERAVRAWLLGCAGLVWVMIVLGGVTRLTGSGLSITHWAPVSGTLPPLTDAAWAAALDAYRASPEGRLVNAGITLEGFRSIFWLEYLHRLLGRALGLAFALPLAWWAVRRQVRGARALRLWGLLALLGAQGVAGWLMVKSGLVDAPHVSHVRLAVHLGLGLTLYVALVWEALGPERLVWRGLARAGALVTGAVFVTALYGALVAGLEAGHFYPTFPLMGERWVPPEVGLLAPAWRDLLENPVTVQLVHRVLALLTTAAVVALWLTGVRARSAVRRAHSALVACVALQAGLGVATLLLHVPVWLAALHQASAVLLLTAALVATWRAAQPAATPASARHAPSPLPAALRSR